MPTTDVRKIAKEVMARGIDPEEFAREQRRRSQADGLTIQEYALWLCK